MTRPAAISGALVDMKNVATHKCLRLTIDVPAERAMEVIAAMGWPTGVAPVMVAVARLNTETPSAGAPVAGQGPPDASAAPAAQTAPTPAVPRRAWSDLSYAEQAGIRCNEELFQEFIGAPDAENAAAEVRRQCRVKSRKDIKAGGTGQLWSALEKSYQEWRNTPRWPA